ncbi:MAG: lipopolysaccharide heptosyltransferase II [Verrucomicrobia bacterium]|nr:lipopolysaccharide heptosyltransferase II [Verrucomicrobiota bacterium]MBT7068980.1 lipopolysaccharide heptosyltransferase II [Verrucomicrobiota bacterium]MBT7702001.1 lipopolysaccharide heptosyltransferase II [Verrucomicrobiota bacterium]
MQRLLICGTNWLGDSIMSMPALQALKRVAPATHLTLLVKPAMLPLWEMHAAVDAAVPIYRGRDGTRLTVAALRRQGYDRAVIFPNSLRSALLPFLVRIPQRIGVPGHWRRLLLTDGVAPRPAGDRSHQAGEYFALLGLEVPPTFAPPALTPSDTAQADAAHALGDAAGRPLLGILPGAARGGSKRWPPEHFASVARALVASHGVRPVVFGTESERAACDAVAAAVGGEVRNLAGQTSLVVLAAALARCRLALTNDSGGMHLASAVGTPVVAVFGLTDPELTGPLGAHDRILCGAEAEARSRDIPRESPAAEAALRRVTPQQVQAAAEAILDAS